MYGNKPLIPQLIPALIFSLYKADPKAFPQYGTNDFVKVMPNIFYVLYISM